MSQKNYEEKDGVVTFSKKLHYLNEKKRIALLAVPYPAMRDLEIDKETKIKVTIKKKSE